MKLNYTLLVAFMLAVGNVTGYVFARYHYLALVRQADLRANKADAATEKEKARKRFDVSTDAIYLVVAGPHCVVSPIMKESK